VRSLVDRYGGNLVRALGAYNAGPNAMDRWVKRFGALAPDELAERTPYLETRRYIRRSLETLMIYRVLYAPDCSFREPDALGGILAQCAPASFSATPPRRAS
jgi:soluble lytic murein transglycosylase-like protein